MPAQVRQQGPTGVDAYDFHEQLEHDLRRLPEREREVVTMLLDGASHQATADKLGITVRTVGNILWRLQQQHAFAALDGPDGAERGGGKEPLQEKSELLSDDA
jgi:DNA-directed RNA polymerase specialized sigma24 family protein